MTKLTDSQLIVLSSAAAREDGAAVLPARMIKAAALKVGASLVARKLMREMRGKPGMPFWREDEDGRAIALVITRAGRSAINADDDDTPVEADVGKKVVLKAPSKPIVAPTSSTKAAHKQACAAPQKVGVKDSTSLTEARPGSKQAKVINLLSRKQGATIEAMIDATGWLPHTTRAMLTGLRKKGYALERLREERVTTYRITVRPDGAAAA